jgi:dihydroflavonol-4-reductase
LKAFITGADGLLGSHIVRQLLDKGVAVKAFILKSSKSPTLDGLDVEIVHGDILDDVDTLTEQIKGCDQVFHIAAITDHWAPSGFIWKVNFDGTKNMLEASVAAGVKKFVFTGSASTIEFGPVDNPGDESGGFPAAYVGVPYMESKYKAHMLVVQYAKDKKLDTSIICPTFMFGEYDSRPSSGELLRQFIVRGLRVSAPGGRSFAYAGDVAAAHVAAAEKGKSGDWYLAGGANLTYKDIFSKAAKIVGIKPPAVTLPRAAILMAGLVGSLNQKITGKPGALNFELAKLSCAYTYYTSQKAIDELGISLTSIDFSIAKSIESLKEYGHIE